MASAQDGQSGAAPCPSDPGVGELLTIIQQLANRNPLSQSKGILAAKVVWLPSLKALLFLPTPHVQVFWTFFSFSSSANSLEQEQKVFCEVLFAGSLSECSQCCRFVAVREESSDCLRVKEKEGGQDQVWRKTGEKPREPGDVNIIDVYR